MSDDDDRLECRHEGIHQVQANIRKHCETHGRSIISVHGGDGLTFAYTIGNALNGLPEMLIIGMSAKDACIVLNFMCDEMVKVNRSYRDGEMIDIGGRFPVNVVEADDVVKDEYTIQATNFLGAIAYRVMQVVVPDADGRFPWQEGCERPYADVPVWRRTRG